MLDDECACYDSSRTSARAAASSFSVAVKEENTSSGHTEESLGSSNNDTEEEGRFSLRTETSVERSERAQANDLFHPDRWNSLMDVIRRRNIVMVDLTQAGLTSAHAHIIHLALLDNPMLSTLKIGFNELKDDGLKIISPAINSHPSLKVLDVGFNYIGDDGCAAISKSLVGNFVVETLYLSGNLIKEEGIVALAQALRQGCGLLHLHLTANRIGARGVMYLANAIAESNHVAHKEPVPLPCDASLCDESSTLQPLKRSCLRDVFLGDTFMSPEGSSSLSKMLLTNTSLRVLSLPNNNLSDCDATLLAQSLSRNKELPLEKIQLSFNKLSCVGVEALMNAVWGSQTLQEIKLDNNRIRDRGAQLAAVVLTSVNLLVLDLGFNLITSVGIKALMKAVAENKTLRSLTLSGNILDTSAARAVSYALALNKSLKEFFVDNCSAVYASQRHIAAGIVSNKASALRVLTGFRLGAIVVTLGFPAPVETWPNDQVLKFIRWMWQNLSMEVTSSAEDSSVSSSHSGEQPNQFKNRDISDPRTVIKVAKLAFEKLNDPTDQVSLATLGADDADNFECPAVPRNAIVLELSESGVLQVPREAEFLLRREATKEAEAAPEISLETHSVCSPQQKRRMASFLQVHCTRLEQLAKKPFNKSELWKLHQQYFSPMDGEDTAESTASLEKCSGSQNSEPAQALSSAVSDDTPFSKSYRCVEPSRTHSMPSSICKTAQPRLNRRASYRSLHDALASTANASMKCEADEATRECQSSRRRYYSREVENGEGDDRRPSTKRARSSRTRVDLYPRIKLKLEEFHQQTSEVQSLVLMRQLSYLDQQIMQLNSDKVGGHDTSVLTPADVEVVLLDLL